MMCLIAHRSIVGAKKVNGLIFGGKISVIFLKFRYEFTSILNKLLIF